jgi:hypothetical protein
LAIAATTGGGSGSTPKATRRVLLVAGVLTFVLAVVALSIPGSGIGGYAPLVVLEWLLLAMPVAAGYLFAGIGFGRLFRPLFRGASDLLALQVGVGLAVMLTVSHLMGWAGLLSGQVGRWVGLGVILVGVALVAHQFQAWLRGRGWEPRVSGPGLLSAAGLGLLIVAACAAPGVHWASEFGGYDVLEYHLQLPSEWLTLRQLRPVAHNVYSFLPGYMEAAYLHLGAATSAGQVSTPSAPVMVTGEGYRLIACQLLHAGFAVVAAWLTARLARRVAGDAAAPVAFGLVLLTPWAIVTGSLAYNEMGLVAMLAAALLVATETGTGAWQRGLVCGLLVGAAASIKPTGLLFVGVPVAFVLLVLARVRDLPAMIGVGCVAGLAVLAPWLIRNALACGNPVFPFAASLFPNSTGGTGEWTAEQVSRYTSAHRFYGSLLDALRLLVLPDAGAAPGAPSAHRGMMHPQWGLLFPFAVLSGGVLLIRRGKDLLPLPLLLLVCGLAAQVALWLFTTHIQSRFLLPLIVPTAVLIAAGIASLGGRLPLALRAALVAVPLAVQFGFSLSTFLNERGGNPNIGLVNGASARTGEAFDGLPPSAVADVLDRAQPELFINLATPPGTRVFLLGDSTPLYITRPVIYQTTYDTSPLGHLEPEEWNRVFKQLKVDLVLVNLSEVRRLERSGWNPPGITVDRVARWMQTYAAPVVAPTRWETTGQYLVAPLAPPPLPEAPR